MPQKQTPPMTSHKARWSAIATALTSVVLALLGVTDVDVEGLTKDATEALTLLAVIAVQGGVAFIVTHYKRNFLK